MWTLGWYGEELHSLPVGDTGQHWTDKYCLCMPEYEEVSGSMFCVHNAWDGREKTEREFAGATFEDTVSHTLDVFRAVR